MYDYYLHHLNAYFHRRLCEISDEEDKVFSAMRTKKGVVILADKLRLLDLERCVIIRMYEDLKYLL